MKHISHYPKIIRDKYKKKVRDKAIEKFEHELRLRQKKVSDFSDDEIEVLIAEEERKIIAMHKSSSYRGIFAILTLGLFI
tara:strand:- start:43 stop:282 length:240 start_codon:yes stop_codon:yes gene_type:complete